MTAVSGEPFAEYVDTHVLAPLGMEAMTCPHERVHLHSGKPKVLFTGRYVADAGRNYDISPDGQRFVMVKETEVQEAAQINVILNWFEELKRLVPTN